MSDDTGLDPAADLPRDDDTLPPFPLVTDPDPGDPNMPHTPDHEELLALRELRRDLDRLLSTEGQPHADVVGAVSGLAVSVGQLRNEVASLRDRLQVAEGSLELIHERAEKALAARSTS